MRAFIDKTNLPFLATPMGKGVVSDFDRHSANSARTFVLQNADVIVLCGARLNWILHFGLPPRFRSDVKIIQIDSDPLEINTNVKSTMPIVGDIKTMLTQICSSLPSEQLCVSDGAWWREIKAQEAKNRQASLTYLLD
jgi:2-hydroxyacyl-CoA lyase 1